MLEVAVIRRPDRQGAFNVAALFNALLFYGKAQLILDSSAFMEILRKIGPKNTLDLARHENIDFWVSPEFIGVQTDWSGSRSFHQPVIAKLSEKPGEKKWSDIRTLMVMKERIPEIPPFSEELLTRILNSGKRKTFSEILENKNWGAALFESAIEDTNTLRMAVAHVAESRNIFASKEQLETISGGFKKFGDKYELFSEQQILKIIPKKEETEKTSAVVLTFIHDYIIDLQLSQLFSGDLIAPKEFADMAESRIDLSISRGLKNQENIENFNQLILEDGARLGDAFEAGALTFKEV